MPAGLPQEILRQGWALVEIAKSKGYVQGSGKSCSFSILGDTVQGEVKVCERMVIVADTRPDVPDLGIYLYVDPMNGRIYKSDPYDNVWQQINEVGQLFTDPR